MVSKAMRLNVNIMKKLNPYGNLLAVEDFGTDFMSPLPPQLKGTFQHKLPTWSETTFLNVNEGIKLKMTA